MEAEPSRSVSHIPRTVPKAAARVPVRPIDRDGRWRVDNGTDAFWNGSRRDAEHAISRRSTRPSSIAATLERRRRPGRQRRTGRATLRSID